MPLPWPRTNEDCARIMAAAVAGFERDSFTHVAFGALFLEDVRRYRVDRLAGTRPSPLFALSKTTDARGLAADTTRTP